MQKNRQTEMVRQELVEALSVLEEFLAHPQNCAHIEAAGRIMVSALSVGKKIISCGNGGSMCDAMHFAEELSGLYRGQRPALAALSISDPSHITCTGNDFGFEHVFSRFVEAVGQEGDVLLAISTSGNSPNVVRACEAARNRKMKVVGLTGKDGGKMASCCDVEVRAPHTRYSDRTQEIHIKVIHTLIHWIEQNI
jgi:D-sedoheptulose 7-phosphate isomerase